MDYLYIFIGGFPIFVALFKRELLVESTSFKVIVGTALTFFIAGIILLYGEKGSYSAVGALMYALPSVGLYRIARWFFVKHFNREPRDTFFTWSRGMDKDRLFNISYFTTALIGLMLFTAGVGKLAEILG